MGLNLFGVESLRDEVKNLRAQNERLTDALLRFMRKDAGMPEVQPVKKEDLSIAMPHDVVKLVNAFASPDIRARREAKAVSCYRATRDWEAVRGVLALPEEEEE